MKASKNRTLANAVPVEMSDQDVRRLISWVSGSGTSSSTAIQSRTSMRLLSDLRRSVASDFRREWSSSSMRMVSVAIELPNPSHRVPDVVDGIGTGGCRKTADAERVSFNGRFRIRPVKVHGLPAVRVHADGGVVTVGDLPFEVLGLPNHGLAAKFAADGHREDAEGWVLEFFGSQLGLSFWLLTDTSVPPLSSPLFLAEVAR